MLKICILLMIIEETYNFYLSGCQQGKIPSPEGCIVDCQAPKFDLCSIKQFWKDKQGEVCGWGAQNRWQTYKVECEACLHNAIGFKKGGCNGKQSLQKIKSQEILLANKPFESAYKYYLSRLSKKKCSMRPTQQECPAIQSASTNYCGIDFDGNFKGFDRPCSACKDKTIISYWEADCSKLYSRESYPISKEVTKRIQSQGESIKAKTRKKWEGYYSGQSSWFN